MSHIISPSLLAADFSKTEQQIELINNSNADWLHIDVMDGVFVPNISFGAPIIEAFKPHINIPFDVHLMIVQPERYLADFKRMGADILNVHYEACTHLHRTIEEIKNLGMKAAVTLNPHTPVNLLEDIIIDLDMVLLMSVNPGFGGQKFIGNTYNKTKALKELIIRKNSKALIEIDGGVNLENAKKLIEIGADALVAGSSIFKTPDPIETIQKFKEL